MKCRRCRTLMKSAFLPGQQSVSEELQAHIESCASCRAVWESLRMIDAGAPLHTEPPAGLSDRIADSILSPGPQQPDAAIDHFPTTRRRYTIPLVAAAVMLVLFSVFFTLQLSTPSQSRDTIVVQLQLEAPRANAVALVGDMNGWQPDTHQLVDDNNDGIWEIELEVSPHEEYQYQFLINGQEWIPDPSAPIQVADGFGGTNSVLNL